MSLPRITGALPAFYCSLAGCVAAAIVAVMCLDKTLIQYFFNIPPGTPTGILYVGPVILLLWLTGGIWGSSVLRRLKESPEPQGGKGLAVAAVLLAAAPLWGLVLMMFF